MKLENLPEKEYFSKSELAQRWECGLDLVDDYLKRGLLREAIHIPSSLAFELSTISYYRCDVSSEVFQLYCDARFERTEHEDNYSFLVRKCKLDTFDIPDESIVHCPEFAYIIPGEAGLMLGSYREGPFRPDEWTVFDVFRFLAGAGDDRYIPVYSDFPTYTPVPLEALRADHRLWGDLVIPRAERDRFENENGISKTRTENKSLSPKTKNAYLRTIRALAEAVIGGLTGKHSKDAQAILTKLELQGLTTPIKEDALAKYLQEAEKLE